MTNKYQNLNRYRIALDKTWEEFAVMLSSTGVPLPTLHKVCTGRSNPNERTAAKLDAFIRAHAEEIQLTLKAK